MFERRGSSKKYHIKRIRDRGLELSDSCFAAAHRCVSESIPGVISRKEYRLPTATWTEISYNVGSRHASTPARLTGVLAAAASKATPVTGYVGNPRVSISLLTRRFTTPFGRSSLREDRLPP